MTMEISKERINILYRLYFYKEDGFIFKEPKKTINGWASLINKNNTTVRIIKELINEEIITPVEKEIINGIEYQLYKIDKNKLIKYIQNDETLCKLYDILKTDSIFVP